MISFLGASYFRPIARAQIYGASARGLAIDTAVGKPEEFPHFRTFWLVKPEDGAAEMTVWALLNSPGATGAFSFTIRPGTRTLVDIKCVLFMRNDISLLGIAPLTSHVLLGQGPRRRAMTIGRRSMIPTAFMSRPARASGSGGRWTIPAPSAAPRSRTATRAASA